MLADRVSQCATSIDSARVKVVDLRRLTSLCQRDNVSAEHVQERECVCDSRRCCCELDVPDVLNECTYRIEEAS